MTAFQRDLLCVIAGMNEPYGLAIKQALEKYYEDEVNHGRLYPNLDELAERGVIEKDTHDKCTNCYTLTEDGYALIEARLDWMTNQIETPSELDL